MDDFSCALVRTVRTHAHSRHRRRSAARPAVELVGSGANIATARPMAQKTVQLVIGWLLTDEDLRLRFKERPRETLGELREQGYELTVDEIDALVRSDPDVWPMLARRIHPRLQRCSLRPSSSPSRH